MIQRFTFITPIIGVITATLLQVPAAFAYQCTGEDRFILEKLGFSSLVADKICADERNMKELRRRALRDMDRARAMKVYRGLYVDPANYVPNRDVNGIGIWVSSDIYEWPLHSAFQKPLQILVPQDLPDLQYGTLIEFELPGYLFPSRRMSRARIETIMLPGGVQSLPLYTSKIGKVNIPLAVREKAAGTLKAYDCLPMAHPIDPSRIPLVEWKIFGK